MKRLRAGAINAIALAIGSGLNFLALFLWTRLLTPAEFGAYALILATVLLVNASAFDWLRMASARTLYDPAAPFSIHPVQANAAICVYLIVLVLMVLIVLLLDATGVPMGSLPADRWLAVAAWVTTEMALALANTLSRLRMLPWQYFRSMVGRGIASIAVGAVLVSVFHMGAQGVVMGTIGAQAAIVAASMALDPFWRSLRPWHATRAELRALILFGGPMILSQMFNYSVAVVDRYVIGWHLGEAAVGYFSVPMDLVQKSLVFIMLAINLTAYPSLVRTFEAEGSAAARREMEDNFLLQLGLGLPAAVGMAVLAPGIARLLVGPAFREEAAILLPLVGVTALFRCMVTFQLSMAFQLAKRTRLMVIPPLICLIVLIPGALIGVRYDGIMGVTIATMVAQFVTYVLTEQLARRVFPFSIYGAPAFKLAIASAAMGLCLLPFRGWTHPVPTIGLIGLGGAVYLAVLLLLRFEPLAMVPGMRRLGLSGWLARRPAAR